jgi:hypothetical protein
MSTLMRGRPQSSALAMTSQTESMAAARVVEGRQTAPIVRCGVGGANGRMVRPRAAANGPSAARRGSSVTPRPGGDHLPQRLEAGGAEVLGFDDVARATDLECLVAQAVAVLEQQQRLAGEVGDADALARRELVSGRHGHNEGLGEQRAAGEGAALRRQCQQPTSISPFLTRSSSGPVWYSYNMSSSLGSARRILGATRGSR